MASAGRSGGDNTLGGYFVFVPVLPTEPRADALLAMNQSENGYIGVLPRGPETPNASVRHGTAALELHRGIGTRPGHAGTCRGTATLCLSPFLCKSAKYFCGRFSSISSRPGPFVAPPSPRGHTDAKSGPYAPPLPGSSKVLCLAQVGQCRSNTGSVFVRRQIRHGMDFKRPHL